MFVVIITVSILILGFIWIFYKPKRKLPPGPKGKPLIGVLTELDTSRTHQQLAEWAPAYGPIYSFNVLGTVSVVLNDVALVREAYTSGEFSNVLNDRPETFFGKYVVFNYSDVGYAMYDDATVKLRKALHKGLHFYGDGVKRSHYSPLQLPETECVGPDKDDLGRYIRFENLMSKELERLVKEIDSYEGQEVDPKTIIGNSMCLLVSALLLGKETKEGDTMTTKVIWEYLDVLNEAMNPGVDTILQKIPALRFIPGNLRAVYLSVLEKRDNILQTFYHDPKKTYDPENERGLIDVFFRLQYQNGKQRLTDEQVMGLVLDAIGAGMLTSSNGIIGLLLTLLNNPTCLAKIREEIDAVVDCDRLPDFQDRVNTPYLEAVVLEGLRYLSHFPLMPHSCKKDVEFEGYLIPKGAQVFANTWYIHHNPELWSDPWSFKPERFLEDSGRLMDAKHPTRMNGLMFGVGPRNCLGESLAKSRIILYLATLVQKFDIVMTSDTPANPDSYKAGLILEPPHYKCKFIRRSSPF